MLICICLYIYIYVYVHIYPVCDGQYLLYETNHMSQTQDHVHVERKTLKSKHTIADKKQIGSVTKTDKKSNIPDDIAYPQGPTAGPGGHEPLCVYIYIYI